MARQRPLFSKLPLMHQGCLKASSSFHRGLEFCAVDCLGTKVAASSVWGNVLKVILPEHALASLHSAAVRTSMAAQQCELSNRVPRCNLGDSRQVEVPTKEFESTAQVMSTMGPAASHGQIMQKS